MTLHEVRARVRPAIDTAVVPVAALGLALLVGAVLILVSTAAVGTFDPWSPVRAYAAMLQGAFGGPALITNTLVVSAPLVLAGLSVGIGFKAGLFNIGAPGQILVGGFVAAVVGARLATSPALFAIPAAVLAGGLGGAAYGWFPGFLKAFTGAHEVVTTIMLNFIAAIVISALVSDLFRAPGFAFVRTPDVGNAALPVIVGRNGHPGVLIALAAPAVTWWLLWRTTLGFELRAFGASPTAARYAGMSPRALTMGAMALCGLFAGLAGTLNILGLVGYYPATYATTLGFDGITVALLGRAHPAGILLSALLLGTMRAGAPLMQVKADVPVEIVDVIQAVILLFIAADFLVRRIVRVRGSASAIDELQTVTRSYGERVSG